MRTKVLSLLVALFFTVPFVSCESDADHFPVTTEMESFINERYPNARIVETERENGTYEVTIVHNNIVKEVIFDQSKQWILTVWDIRIAELPQSVADAKNNTQYADYRIDDADFVETPKQNYYLLELEKGKQEVKIRVAEDGTLLDTKADEIPTNTYKGLTAEMETFIQEKYPNARIKDVDREHNSVEVEIIHDNKEKDVLFDLSSQWLYTTWELRIADLPANIAAAKNNTQYADYRIDDADFVETPQQNFYLLELEKGNREVKIKVAEDGTILD